MGWGAAQAFYEENAEWLDNVEDAYEALYGRTENKRPKNRCDLCGKRLKNARGLRDHMRDKHAQEGE